MMDCNYILEEGERKKAQKKFPALGENQTHDPVRSSSDALTTELLEAVWKAGSKFNKNYTNHSQQLQRSQKYRIIQFH